MMAVRGSSPSSRISRSTKLEITYQEKDTYSPILPQSAVSVSGCSDESVPVSGWKPRSMRPPALILFITFSLGLAVAIEVVAQRSLNQGGLSLSASADDIPAVVTFSYLTLPTLFAVLYSLIWTWIDLDIRRIQPWLELSRPNGALAEHSLLLDYPFEFLAFVPFKAWKRGHWPVALAGIIMMIIFWLITPLQGAIFGTQLVVIKTSSIMSSSSVLLPPEQQSSVLDVSLLARAFGSTWLDQEMPPYTTTSYALLPFYPQAQDGFPGPNETWVGNTTKLTTDLSCWPALATQGDARATFEFDDGRGCKANVSLLGFGREAFSVLYIPYWNDPHVDWFLQNSHCGPAASHRFLAVWAHLFNGSAVADMTALFCETSYAKETVRVTMSARTLLPVANSVESLGDAVELREDEFNITAFEYLIGTGVPSVTKPRDYAAETALEQFSRLYNRNVTWPGTNMAGFGLGRFKEPIARLQDATTLESIFASAHKELFSLAVSRLLHTSEDPVSIPGYIQQTMYGVVVSRSFSLAVESLLVAVALATAFVLLVCRRAKSNLGQDPASLGSLFRILKESATLLSSLFPADRFDQTSLRNYISGREYQLVASHGYPLQSSRHNIRLEARPMPKAVAIAKKEQGHASTSGCYFEPFRPLELRPSTGMAVVTTLLTAAGVLLYLKRREQILGGLVRPTENFEILQILENYVPLVFATLLEPFFMVINRLLCLLQPFHDLRRGHAPASTTIDAQYASLPPQLNIIRAIRSRHFLLAALCLVSIFTNVLAVALGAIFNEFPVSANHRIEVAPLRNGSLSRKTIVPYTITVPFYEHFYIALANISDTNLPPWMDRQFVYLPFSQPPFSDTNSLVAYQAETRGFGFDPHCSALSTSPDSTIFANYSQQVNDLGEQQFVVNLRTENRSVIECELVNPISGTPNATAKSTIEVVSPLMARWVASSEDNSGFQVEDDGLCEQYLVAAWMRTDSSSFDGEGTVDMTLIQCQPVLQTASFQVTVDTEGHILHSRRIGGFDDITLFMDFNQSLSLAAQANTLIGIGKAKPGWHNDTLTRDWPNYLLSLSLNSTRLVDPAQTVPAGDDAMTLVSTLYQRLGASLLGVDLTLFQAADGSPPVPGTVTVIETRIFMNYSAFIISVTILTLSAIVTAAVYTREKSFYLPMLPSTIGALIAFVAAGRIIKDYEGKDSEHDQGNADFKAPSAATYSFGSYVGIDGRPHVGIERDPFVVPLDESYMRRHSKLSSFRWRFGRRVTEVS